ncbi:hypothetical protein [Pukyongiella litopenaei]|uniref:Uncharacterized protein n=1 Tax=Pukyongiella litopenaei TaxID=2605946 RepID=A0A2S0MKH9_9RHOB|nr:hypothetical protein [Pukyongiella litopenaei]AVO36380.1 hypothetical protein C6Y53_00755 [Pukyongiella litopenaei]
MTGDILELLATYSPLAILFAALVAAGVFLVQKSTERAILAEFDRRAKLFELGVERRSRFEEMILLERYETIGDILNRLTRIASDLNRRRHGTEVEGLIRDGDIVPLTEVFEILGARRHILTERFHPILGQMAGLLIRLANTPDDAAARQVQDEYGALQSRLQDEITTAFGLDRIVWAEP